MVKKSKQNISYKSHIEPQASAMIPTHWGKFNVIAFSGSNSDQMPHLAIVSENFEPGKKIITRIHSECLTGDLFGSKRCDCGEQLDYAMQTAANENGMVLYLRQEGRGIGLINKLKAYNLQDKGLNTIEANLHLGLEADSRQYGIAIDILNHLGVDKIDLLTNNPLKINAFDNSPITVVNRRPIEIQPKQENHQYLKTKQDQMGHLLNLL